MNDPDDGIPDPASLRLRARDLALVARSAEQAAARFAARSLAGQRAADDEAIAGALAGMAQAHRRAAEVVDAYAGDLEGAAHRRRALDDLIGAAQSAPTRDDGFLARIEVLREQLLRRLRADLEASARRCATDLSSATPSPADAAEVARAIGAAVDLTRSRLLQAAGTAGGPGEPGWQVGRSRRSV